MKQRADINLTQLNFSAAISTAAAPLQFPGAGLWLSLPNMFLIYIVGHISSTNANLYWRLKSPNGIIVPNNNIFIYASLRDEATIYLETDKKLLGPPYEVQLELYTDVAAVGGLTFATSDDSGYSELVETNNKLEKIFELIRTKPSK